MIATSRPTASHRGTETLSTYLVLGGVLTAATVLVALVDPNRPGHYPVCPLYALTGWYCPACGGLRAAHDLAHGDLAAAVAMNPLLAVLLPVAALAWLYATARAAGAPWPAVRLPRCTGAVALVLVVLFGLARNLPGAGWLAPH